MRRVMSVLGVLALSLGSIAVTASPAAAVAPNCAHDSVAWAAEEGWGYVTHVSLSGSSSCDFRYIYSFNRAVWRMQVTLNTCYGLNGPGRPGGENVIKFWVDEDGEYGDQTREAVRRVQARHGLSQDGWAGPNTRKAMRHVLESEDRYCHHVRVNSAGNVVIENWWVW